MTNKTVLKGLEIVSEHGASFIAGTSLAMALAVRPLAISATPKVKKENKQYAITNSITSGLIKFGIVEAVALPVENAIKNIDKNPDKFLTKDTLNKFKAQADNLINSKDYKFATQVLKLATGFLTAIPKSVLTVALIPIVMDLLFAKKNKNFSDSNKGINIYNQNTSDVFNDINKKNNPSFKGSFTDTVSKGISKIINNNTFQNIIHKHSSNDKNIARNITMATDILLSASFAHRTIKNKDIDNNRKKPLIYNHIISTGLSLLGGYSVDKFVKKNTESFIKKFSEANKNDPKLAKYIEGINIVRPTLIFAAIYYGAVPLISTFMAEKFSKRSDTI